jgi:hypothetical protein
MELHNFDLSHNILNPTDYAYNRNPPKNYKLLEKILCYFDGYSRKIIPLSVALSYPIINDFYIDKYEVLHNMTIIICPFTLATIALEGHFTATNYVSQHCLVVTNGQETFSVLDVYKYPNIHKFDVGIKILRNIFTEFTDCKYMIINKQISIPDNILPKSYYINDDSLTKPDSDKLNLDIKKSERFDAETDNKLIKKINNKALVNLIIYTSSKDQSIQRSILVGRYIDYQDSGYNLHKSGIYNYLSIYNNKIKEKHGIIIPVLWFAVKPYLDNSKIIYL